MTAATTAVAAATTTALPMATMRTHVEAALTRPIQPPTSVPAPRSGWRARSPTGPRSQAYEMAMDGYLDELCGPLLM